MFWEKFMCYSIFEKTFSYLSWLSLLLILESGSLQSWFLKSWSLESWFLKSTFLLNLEVFLILSWISWTHSLIDLWAFCHHLCHYLLLSSLLSSKHLWITLDSSWSFASTLSLPRKVLCSKTCAIHLFHSLLPLPKRIRQGLTTWILFVSLFSLFQKNKGLPAWILLCLPSPLSKNSKRHSLRILLILPFPINKRFQRTNRLRILLFPPSQSFEGLTAGELFLNTLEGTSFVGQVEGRSTWVVD